MERSAVNIDGLTGKTQRWGLGWMEEVVRGYGRLEALRSSGHNEEGQGMLSIVDETRN